eukprot:Nk52_evm48s255 gene=Nk52_evmTU48s255
MDLLGDYSSSSSDEDEGKHGLGKHLRSEDSLSGFGNIQRAEAPSLVNQTTRQQATEACTFVEMYPFQVNPYIDLPETFEGSCSNVLDEKLKKFMTLTSEGHSINKQLKHSKAFRNPTIYNGLVNLLHISESGSNRVE